MNNCKLCKIEYIDLMAVGKKRKAISMNNLIDHRNAFVQGFIRKHCTLGIIVHHHMTDHDDQIMMVMT